MAVTKKTPVTLEFTKARYDENPFEATKESLEVISNKTNQGVSVAENEVML